MHSSTKIPSRRAGGRTVPTTLEEIVRCLQELTPDDRQVVNTVRQLMARGALRRRRAA